jgi:hypothetical protein
MPDGTDRIVEQLSESSHILSRIKNHMALNVVLQGEDWE